MFGTTKLFLDYFGLKKLDDLPPLADLSDWESLRVQLNLPAVDEDEEPEPAGQVTDLPVLYPEDEEADSADDVADTLDNEFAADDNRLESEGDSSDETGIVVEEIPGIEAALSAEGNLEPIEATEWPDPSEEQTIVRAVELTPDPEQEEDQEEIDSSVTSVQ
jgi:segregation and condensation protein B